MATKTKKIARKRQPSSSRKRAVLPKKKVAKTNGTRRKPANKISAKKIQQRLRRAKRKVNKWYRRQARHFSTWSRPYLRWVSQNALYLQNQASHHQRTLSLIGIFLGIQLMLLAGWHLLYSRTVLSFQVSPVVIQDVEGHQPARVLLENQAIDLPLISVEIQNGIWPTSQDSANHLVTSARPGQPSNIVVYGHNKPHLFGPLHQVEIGDEIILESSSGRKFRYQAESIHKVSPSEIELVLPTDDEVLTIYTCTGWFDSQRLVIQARPIDADI